MTQQQYIIRRKLNLVELSSQLGNISEACRKLGVSRQHYYDIKSALEEDGIEGLLEKARNRPRFRNRVAVEIEQRVLDYSLEYPVHGQSRVSNELKKAGIILSPGGVRSIWLRHGLEKRGQRLKRLEKWAAEHNNVLTENQLQALESAKEEKQAHGAIESFHPGFLLGQDTFYVGWIKGIGKIYQQTGIDTYSNVGFAKLYLDKNGSHSRRFPQRQGATVLRFACGSATAYPYRPGHGILRGAGKPPVPALHVPQRYRP